jgi:hypothetical protein
MRYMLKKVLYVAYLAVFSIHGHGFGPNTLVHLADGSCNTIASICLSTLRNRMSITSYDINNSCNVKQFVALGKQSKTNCYVQLGFDNQTNHPDDIVCTPTQEFYVSTVGKWIPAYLLKPGDALLTRNTSSKIITHKEFMPQYLTIYMLEIQRSHTFFVGKHAILTHNILLPLAVNLGFVVPFGSVASGAAGSFFGPIGLVGGVVLGGIASIAIKAIYKNRIQKYDTPTFNISFIRNSCDNIPFHIEEIKTTSPGCFKVQDPIDTACSYPIENPLPQISTGCFEIEVNALDRYTTHGCNQNHEKEKQHSSGCFQPTSEPISENPNVRDKKPTARNWKEFENTPIGQKYGKNFIPTGKQNSKDGSPIRRLAENIPNTEMFKKGYLFALDRFHDGDHFEVWDKNGKWIGVANLDGSRNHKKTNAEKNPPKRDLTD